MNLKLNWFGDSNYLQTETETVTGSEIGTMIAYGEISGN